MTTEQYPTWVPCFHSQKFPVGLEPTILFHSTGRETHWAVCWVGQHKFWRQASRKSIKGPETGSPRVLGICSILHRDGSWDQYTKEAERVPNFPLPDPWPPEKALLLPLTPTGTALILATKAPYLVRPPNTQWHHDAGLHQLWAKANAWFTLLARISKETII